jgi:hypothetical protein
MVALLFTVLLLPAEMYGKYLQSSIRYTTPPRETCAAAPQRRRPPAGFDR